MLSYDQLRAQVRIDPNNLQEDCAKQPTLYLEAVELASDAKAQAKAARIALDSIQADIQLQFRAEKIKTDVKITEASILALVASHPAVKKSRESLIEAESYSADCDGLLVAFDHRRSMLTNEVSMFVQGGYHMADVKPRLREQGRASAEDEIVQTRKE